MRKGSFGIALGALATALLFCAPASAETYNVTIHNGTDRAVTFHTESSECMRRALPRADVQAGQTWHGSVETETKESNCWMLHRSSVLDVRFSQDHWTTLIKVDKMPLLRWGGRTMQRRALRARVEGGLSSFRINVTNY